MLRLQRGAFNVVVALTLMAVTLVVIVFAPSSRAAPGPTINKHWYTFPRTCQYSKPTGGGLGDDCPHPKGSEDAKRCTYWPPQGGLEMHIAGPLIPDEKRAARYVIAVRDCRRTIRHKKLTVHFDILHGSYTVRRTIQRLGPGQVERWKVTIPNGKLMCGHGRDDSIGHPPIVICPNLFLIDMHMTWSRTEFNNSFAGAIKVVP